jgi:uncharacterized damage-inducible protein DinB
MSDTATFLTPSELLEHWQGHRRLTRRTIEAFPEDQLFSYRVEPMRTFAEMMLEVTGMLEPTLRGLLGQGWEWQGSPKVETKAALLGAYDKATSFLNEHWSDIPEQQFHEVHTAFGQFTMSGANLILYLIDNEIHHRAQGYVYLRLLGIEPPAFYER